MFYAPKEKTKIKQKRGNAFNVSTGQFSEPFLDKLTEPPSNVHRTEQCYLRKEVTIAI